MKSNIVAFGIDLGTTNSTLAVVHAPASGEAVPVAEVVEIPQPTLSGEKISAIVPSVVAIYEGREWIGEGGREIRNLAFDPARRIIRNQSLFYETKNEIGTSRTYRGANGIESPIDVAARVLAFVRENGIEADRVENVVVTVPASFQVRQRNDTMTACQRAGLNVDGHRLLDEPCAAFIDYATRYNQSLLNVGDDPKRLLVFDFGGGTCDVAIFELTKPDDGPIRMKSLSVSRYHRLGGGDIDLAIIHEILIPRLLRENTLGAFDIDFDEQQAVFVPALLSVAETLKIQISNEIARLREFGQYEQRKAGTVARFPAITRIRSTRLGRELTLSSESATLSAEQFEELLVPMLSTEQLAPQITEDRLECSIFAPIEDALERADLSHSEIDYVFAVGGSALIPNVLDAIREEFSRAELLTFPSRQDFQFAIARGAALQAWSLAARGQGLVRPVAQDDLLLQAEGGEILLIQRGEDLPTPRQGWATTSAIAVPEDATDRGLRVAFNIVAGPERRLVGCAVLDVAGVPQGTPFELRYRFDENQVFVASARLRDFAEAAKAEITIENPVSNVVNPNASIEKRDQWLEQLRAEPNQWEAILPQLARVCAELGHFKQAIGYLKAFQRKHGAPNEWALNLQAIYEGRRGNKDGAIRCYELAAKLPGADGTPCFNLAILLMQLDRLSDGLRWIEEAIARDVDPPYRVLRLQILQKLGKELDYASEMKQVVGRINALSSVADWELGWYLTGAKVAGDPLLAETIAAEQRRRRHSTEETEGNDGVLPLFVDGG